MPAFSYVVPQNQARSPLGQLSQQENVQENVGATKLERIARRGVENTASSAEEQAVEAAVALLEKCALAGRKGPRKSAEDEAEAAEEAAVALVRACAAAACKHSGKVPTQREATKLTLQARIADLETEIATSKAKLQPAEESFQTVVLTKVANSMRTAKNPFEPTSQNALKARLQDVESRLATSKEELREKLAAKENCQLVQKEAALRATLGDLRGELQSYEGKRQELQAQLDQSVEQHTAQAMALQSELQATIDANLAQRAALADQLATCDAKAIRVEKELATMEA